VVELFIVIALIGLAPIAIMVAGLSMTRGKDNDRAMARPVFLMGLFLTAFVTPVCIWALFALPFA
jgi:hypothetical protein